jgi:hypothetical protein
MGFFFVTHFPMNGYRIVAQLSMNVPRPTSKPVHLWVLNLGKTAETRELILLRRIH